MTKAERIFNNTYTECRIHTKTWGMQRNPNGKAIGFTGLIKRDSDTSCKRTWNAIQKLIDSKKKQVEIALKYDFGDREYYEMCSFALEMVQSSLDNEINNWTNF